MATINIPDGITEITEHTFQQAGVTSIVLPASVTSLKVCAFQDATKLSSINLENIREVVSWSLSGTALTSVELTNVPFIGACAISACPELETVVLKGVVGTGDWTFQNCPKLKTVKMNDIESLNAGTFSGCASLESLVLPKSLAFIGDWALEKNGLKEIFISWDNPENQVYIEENAFGQDEGKADFTWKVPEDLEDIYGSTWMGYPVEVGASSIGNTQLENGNAYYANGVLNLVNLEGYSADIISLNGVAVSHVQVESANYELPVNLASGVYLLKATNGNAKVATKFIVK
jgi:hypothetical protein